MVEHAPICRSSKRLKEPERWRRWHISMSHWFRDYIFIPLGGSRKGKFRTQVNIMLVMFLSGLWHGASNNFVVWGLGNGATMVGHKLLIKPLRFVSTRMERHPITRVGYYYLCCLMTFFMISSINIFFRCPDWETAKSFVRAIFLSGTDRYVQLFHTGFRMPEELWQGLGWLGLVFVAHELQRYFDVRSKILASRRTWAITCLASFWWIITFGISGPEFIYYQF